MVLPSKNCQIFSKADGGIGNFLPPPGGIWQNKNTVPYSDWGDLTFLGFGWWEEKTFWKVSPCYICKTYKNPDGTWAIAEKRTLQNLLEDHELWKESEESRAFLKNYNNVQNPPLFTNEKLQNTLLFKILPIPGLHCIKLGGVNLLFKHLG